MTSSASDPRSSHLCLVVARAARALAAILALALAPALAPACPQCSPEVRAAVHQGTRGPGFARDLGLMGLPFLATLGLAAALLRSAMRRAPR